MNIAKAAISPNSSKRGVGEPYLKIQLDQRSIAALPMKYAQEVVVVAAKRLTSIPNMPIFTLGLINQRSRVFWVVDLAQMLEFSPLNKDEQNYNVVIIRVDDIPLGLAVKEVNGVIRVNQELIQSPQGSVPAGLTPYLKGCFLQQQSIVLILEPEAIVNSSVLHNY